MKNNIFLSIFLISLFISLFSVSCNDGLLDQVNTNTVSTGNFWSSEADAQAAENAIESARGIAYPNALNLPIDESKIPSFVKPYIELTDCGCNLHMFTLIN